MAKDKTTASPLLHEFTKGIVSQNPVLVLVLGLCPSLAVTSSVTNAVGMGLAVTAVLIMSNLVISSVRKWIPGKIRIPCFIVIIATFVSVIQLVMKAYFPAIDRALGIFLPLIVVNCIILGRAEAFASRHNVLKSIFDGAGMGVGFTLALMVVSGFREFLGTGQLFGIPVTEAFTSESPIIKPAGIFIMAPGAFLVFSIVLAAMSRINRGGVDDAHFRTVFERGVRLPEEVKKLMAAGDAAQKKADNPLIEKPEQNTKS